MEAIFLSGNTYSNDDTILEKIALIFVEINSISDYYDLISEYINKISEFTFYLVFIIKNSLKIKAAVMNDFLYLLLNFGVVLAMKRLIGLNRNIVTILALLVESQHPQQVLKFKKNIFQLFIHN